MMLNKLVKIFTVSVLLGSLVGCGASFQKVGMHADDTVITAKVKHGIIKHKFACGNDIHVATKSGVVYLSGLVNDRRAAQMARDEAYNIKGVDSVDTTNLFVKKHRRA